MAKNVSAVRMARIGGRAAAIVSSAQTDWLVPLDAKQKTWGWFPGGRQGDEEPTYTLKVEGRKGSYNVLCSCGEQKSAAHALQAEAEGKDLGPHGDGRCKHSLGVQHKLEQIDMIEICKKLPSEPKLYNGYSQPMSLLAEARTAFKEQLANGKSDEPVRKPAPKKVPAVLVSGITQFVPHPTYPERKLKIGSVLEVDGRQVPQWRFKMPEELDNAAAIAAFETYYNSGNGPAKFRASIVSVSEAWAEKLSPPPFAM